jgi:hypothetical protein
MKTLNTFEATDILFITAIRISSMLHLVPVESQKGSSGAMLTGSTVTSLILILSIFVFPYF